MFCVDKLLSTFKACITHLVHIVALQQRVNAASLSTAVGLKLKFIFKKSSVAH